MKHFSLKVVDGGSAKSVIEVEYRSETKCFVSTVYLIIGVIVMLNVSCYLDSRRDLLDGPLPR